MLHAASEPTCWVNTSLPGNAVHESDSVEVNCSVDYRGSWMPVVNCTPHAPAQPAVAEALSSRRVIYRHVMAAVDIGDWAVISCETRFVYRAWNVSLASEQIDYLMDAPRYHHTWQSSPILVFNITGRPNTRRRAITVQSLNSDSLAIVLNRNLLVAVTS